MESIDEYLARGGKIQRIPRGVSGENLCVKRNRRENIEARKRRDTFERRTAGDKRRAR